ncbi:class I SAM-dependent methyltransferase [Mesorhizobium sp. BE184]|uniref:class I SAM-dependent methyltransferase n=1 Tax=Mesorhizobium sp. BE184 TaxID=2817714 RepID=UPI00286CF150|nr:class I SAM-dependent methyltransferase [Mesorhizobium sp. BE184]
MISYQTLPAVCALHRPWVRINGQGSFSSVDRRQENLVDGFGQTFDDWCSHIPGLRKTGDRQWTHVKESAVSYPQAGLARLAEIEPVSFWFRHRNNVIVAALKRYPPHGRLVDIGGGNGFVSLAMAQAGIDCVVVEPDAGGAATAVSRGLPVVCAAFQNLDLRAASLDAIGMFDVLEHIEDEGGVLDELFHKLKPGGMIYITVPAYRFLWSREDVYAGHFRRYSRRRLDRALRQAGFAPLYSSYFFSLLVPAVAAFRSIPSLLRLGRRRAHDIDPQDHQLPGGIAASVLKGSFQAEVRRISRGRRVAFGTSCLAIARKADGGGSEAGGGND